MRLLNLLPAMVFFAFGSLLIYRGLCAMHLGELPPNVARCANCALGGLCVASFGALLSGLGILLAIWPPEPPNLQR